MDIHNTMEDVVLQYLEELLEFKENICKCYRCKIDMACYALNKVRPMYVVSSRGGIHTENIKKNHVQNEIDIYATVAEAIDVVSSTRRHEVNEKLNSEDDDYKEDYSRFYSESGCYFNFPQIVGRILDSETINPVSDAQITLCHDTTDEKIQMFNKLWNNPIHIVLQTKGTYSFWPVPIPAPKAGLQKDFHLNIKIEKHGYEPLRKFLIIRTISDNRLRRYIKKENIYYIDDIFINNVEEEKLQNNA